MAQLVEVLEWLGLSTDDADDNDNPLMPLEGTSDQTVSGLDLPPFETTLTRGQRNGAIGGAQWAREATVQARLLALSSVRLLQLRQAMKPRPRPTDEQPLKFEGFGFPSTHRMWVRPTLCQYRLGAGNIAAEVFVVDCAWTSTDGLVYSDTQTTHSFSGTSAAFKVNNLGMEVGTAGRAIEVRITATGGPVVSPWVRFDHPGGTWERVTFDGLTIGTGQTLTIAGDRIPRVGTQIVSGRMRSQTQAGGPTRAPRWWRLTPGESDVTVGRSSGTMTGSVRIRSVW
jgi:hypothetical protein